MLIPLSLFLLFFSVLSGFIMAAGVTGFDLKISLSISIFSFLFTELLIIGIAFFTLRKVDPVREVVFSETAVTGKKRKKQTCIEYSDINCVTICTKNDTKIYSIWIGSNEALITLPNFTDYDMIVTYLKDKIPKSAFSYNNYKSMSWKKIITIGLLLFSGFIVFSFVAATFLTRDQIKLLSPLVIGIGAIYQGIVSKKKKSKIFYIAAGVILVSLFAFIFGHSFLN